LPGAEPRINRCVIDRIKTGVRAIDRMEERQEMHAAERTRHRSIEHLLKIAERAPGEAVDVCDELRLTLHRRGRAPRTAATAAPARFAKSATCRAGHPAIRPGMRAAAKASPAPTVSATATRTPAASTYSSPTSIAQPRAPSVTH